ncbi:MAG: hypothetical protein V1809_02950 [Planctomycetota bacterium]
MKKYSRMRMSRLAAVVAAIVILVAGARLVAGSYMTSPDLGVLLRLEPGDVAVDAPGAGNVSVPTQGRYCLQAYDVLNEGILSRIPVVNFISNGIASLGVGVESHIVTSVDNARRIEHSNWKIEAGYTNSTTALTFTLKF